MRNFYSWLNDAKYNFVENQGQNEQLMGYIPIFTQKLKELGVDTSHMKPDYLKTLASQALGITRQNGQRDAFLSKIASQYKSWIASKGASGGKSPQPAANGGGQQIPNAGKTAAPTAVPANQKAKQDQAKKELDESVTKLRNMFTDKRIPEGWELKGRIQPNGEIGVELTGPTYQKQYFNHWDVDNMYDFITSDNGQQPQPQQQYR